MNKLSNKEVWVVSGVRTPFTKADKELKDVGAVALSTHVMNEMNEKLGVNPSYVFWGTVVPNLAYSNIAREVVMLSNISDETVAFSSTLACATSLVNGIQAASMITDDEIAIIGGVESMSNVQIGLTNASSRWVKSLGNSKGFWLKLKRLSGIFKIKLLIPKRVNNVTGLSMGEHAEITAKRLGIERNSQDELALRSHQNYFIAKEKGFYNDLIIPGFGLAEDTIPRKNTSLAKLAELKPVFDVKSGMGTLTAGNSTLFSDGAAAAFIVGKNALNNVKSNYKAKILDWEMAGVKIEEEGMLMAPSFAIPRLLERNKLTYEDIDVWEIHEAFASQVLATIKNLENEDHLYKVGVKQKLGKFPFEKLNPNGSSLATGHPFGATGARILSQATKELALKGIGKKAVISVCADGGLGAVMLIES